jgi:hypothetical protein
VVENNLTEVTGSSAVEKATEMKDIADHAQDAIVGEFGNSEPATRPDNDVVSQRPQQHDHVLSGKAFLGAFGDALPLLISLEGGLDAPTPRPHSPCPYAGAVTPFSSKRWRVFRDAPLPFLRSMSISAAMLRAISSGVSAPRSKPMGA